MSRKIDHIVYCVHNLEESIDYFESQLGIRPVIGGVHQTKGTKNALLDLGNQCYLEILSIDNENINFKGDRWMGIDQLGKPKITRWSLKSDNLTADSLVLSQYNRNLSQINKGSRMTGSGKLLAWNMILPASKPEIEVIPFMTNWSNSDNHPTDSLEKGCFLKNIKLYYPNPLTVESTLQDLGVDLEILEIGVPRIEIVIKSPKGTHTIC